MKVIHNLFPPRESHFQCMRLTNTEISDLAPPANFRPIRTLDSNAKEVRELGPLLMNPGLGANDDLDVRDNLLNPSDCPDIQQLISRGVAVSYDVLCP